MTQRLYPGNLEEMQTLSERLRWVMEWKGWSAREWARRARLQEESHINTIMRRERMGGEARCDYQTLVSLADSASISLEWLATGRGHPQVPDVTIPGDPLYPSRARALLGAQVMGYPQPVLEIVAAIDNLPTDPGLEKWRRILDAELRRFEVMSPESPPALPPGKGRRDT